MKTEYDFSQATRGARVTTPNKQRVTIRLDSDIVDHFKNLTQGGGNYQTLINDALRAHLEHQDQNLEQTLRSIIREEFKALQTA